MGAYKIKVKIELVECEEKEKGSDLRKLEDDSFTMTIRERDALSIDKCEAAVLQTAYPTIREAVSKHLTEMSKKKPLKKPNPEK